MKKSLITLFGMLLMSLLVACGGNKVDDATEEKYTTQAKEVVSLLNENNYEEVYTMFNHEMEEGLSIEEMDEFTPLLADSGDFEEFDKTSVEEKDGIYVTVLSAKYSDDNRIFTISFNNDEEIAGLFIK